MDGGGIGEVLVVKNVWVKYGGNMDGVGEMGGRNGEVCWGVWEVRGDVGKYKVGVEEVWKRVSGEFGGCGEVGESVLGCG